MSSSWLRHTARFLLLAACVQLNPVVQTRSFADDQDYLKPSIPPALRQPEVTDAFRCERRFLYKGKVIGCDSNVQRDAERLRPILQDVPAAIAELDSYQKNRQNVRVAAYVGSMGLLIALGGLLVSRLFFYQDNTLTNTGNSVRAYTAISGLGITGISFIYGLSILSTNESHIDRAVEYHNAAHPNTPIELQFSTGFNL